MLAGTLKSCAFKCPILKALSLQTNQGVIMNNEYLLNIIKGVAKEQDYLVEGDEIYIDRYNSVAFSIHENDSEYIQVHQWEYTDDNGGGRYGRAVYSLRNISDVIQFCSIMIASANIRAKRKA